MATVTGLTAEKTLELLDEDIIAAVVSGDDLILTTRGGDTINAGNVRGAAGADGADGADAATGDVNPTAGTTPIRDASGRVKGFTPSASDDLTTKAYVDAADTAAIATAGTAADTKDTAKIAAFLAADQTFAGNVTVGGLVSTGVHVTEFSAGSLANNTTTTDAPVAGTSGTSFVAPASGNVVITLTMYLKSSTAGVYSMGGLIVRAGGTVGSGTVFATKSALIINANTQWIRCSGAVAITGLTPGSTYNVQAVFHSDTAGTSVSGSAYTFVINPAH